ncbi:MAG: hypothetical protein LC729_01820 [Acidobacteria bacterium]|nr:hypothetical protein [Acidobacteriota bacterium]
MPIQLPYLVSGGFTGLGVVAVGLTLIIVGTKRRDAAAREQRLRKLSSSLESIATALKGSAPIDDVRSGDD